MSKKKVSVLITAIFALSIMFVPFRVRAQGASATGKSVAPIQTQETEFGGVVAELMECKRKEGVLTVKVTFRNPTDKHENVNIDTGHGAYDHIYVTANNKKYFVLKDSEKNPLAPKYISGGLNKGEKLLWWAKFPAPPPDVKKIDLIMEKVLPFEDVPITD